MSLMEQQYKILLESGNISNLQYSTTAFFNRSFKRRKAFACSITKKICTLAYLTRSE